MLWDVMDIPYIPGKEESFQCNVVLRVWQTGKVFLCLKINDDKCAIRIHIQVGGLQGPVIPFGWACFLSAYKQNTTKHRGKGHIKEATTTMISLICGV